jgi:hypothetical protein
LYSIPELLYKKADHVEFKTEPGGETRFEVLKAKRYSFTGETKRKKGACWEIGETYDGGVHVENIR